MSLLDLLFVIAWLTGCVLAFLILLRANETVQEHRPDGRCCPDGCREARMTVRAIIEDELSKEPRND